MHVINHRTGEEMSESRNVLTESARLARGEIKALHEANVEEFDALIIPGGFGAAKAPAKPKKKGKGKKGAVPAHTEKALRDLNERAEAEARARGGYAKGKDVKVVNSVEEARAEEERLKAAEEAEAAQRDAHMLLVRAAVEMPQGALRLC